MTTVGSTGSPTTPDVVAAAIRGLRDRLAELDAEIARVDPLRVERDQVQRALDALDAIGPGIPIGSPVAAPKPSLPAKPQKPQKPQRKPVARTASGTPARKYTDEMVNAAVRRLRVFTVRRFADAVGADNPAAVYTYVYRLRDAGAIREIKSADRRIGRYYVAADYHGPHSVAMAHGDEPVPEAAKPAPPDVSAGESRMLERTRDFVAQQRTSFTPLAVAEALGIDKGAATALLDQLAARDVGGWADDDHMQYRYERPTDPGPGARFNADGPGDETRRVGGNGQPVPGTGAGTVLSPNKEVAQLVARMEAAGGVARKTDGGHIEVTAPSGQRVVMASTPSKPAMSETRAQARRAGLDV
jgi:hypothetical protein